MRITQFFNDNSKNAEYMRWYITHTKGDIYEAYNRPSKAKICAFESIRNEYTYNDTVVRGIPCKTIIPPRSLHKLSDEMFIRYISGTLNIAGASSHFFSTVAVFEDVETEERYIIKETYGNTYMCRL